MDFSGRRTERHVVVVQFEELAFSEDSSLVSLGKTSSTASSIVGEGQVHAEGKGIRIQLRVLSGSGEKFYFILL